VTKALYEIAKIKIE